MVMPTWEQILFPLLKFCSDKNEHSNSETVEKLARYFNLSPQEINEKLRSGQSKFINRVGWAKLALNKAGLLESPKRAYIKITDEGIKLLDEGIKDIDSEYLYKNYQIYAKWQDEMYNKYRENKNSKQKHSEINTEKRTPQEIIEEQYNLLRDNLIKELIDKLKKVTPGEFEEIVLDLLRSLGYGEGLISRTKHTGQTGDEGIDGIIEEDKLGLDNVYIQAKRWGESAIGRPDIQRFVGALKGKGNKGIFITTSNFSKEAKEYAEHLSPEKVVLINGEKLADLMIDNDIGVSTTADYKIKRLNEDYFSSID